MSEDKEYDKNEPINPWSDDAIDSWNNKFKKNQEKISVLGERYNDCYKNPKNNDGKDFSWMLKEDEDKMDFKGEDNKTKDGKLQPCDKSVRWGIPNQVIGDYKESNFFLCLLNPRTRNDKDHKKDEKLRDYIVIEDEEDPNELQDSDDWSKAINQKEIFYPTEKDGVNQYVKHIYDNDENVLVKEVSDLKKEVSKIEEDESKKYDFQDKKFLKKYYYLHTYYNFIFRDKLGISGVNQEGKVFEKFKNGEIDPSKLKICDLELFPYRTNNGNGIKFKNYTDTGKKKRYTYSDLKSSLYAAALIVYRIEIYKELSEKSKNGTGEEEFQSGKPVFVFRAYKSWEATIKAYLKSDLYKGKLKFEEIEDYFYRFPNQGGSLSQNNIYKVKLPEKQYKFIEDAIG